LAYDFLRQDIKNVDDFFSRRGVRTLGMKGTFEFVTGGDERGDGETEETLMERVGDLAGRSERDPERSEEEEPRGVDQPASKTVSFQDTSDPSLVLPPSRSQSSYNDEAVFQHAYIPRNLNEVFDVERDVAKVQRGEGKDLIYSNLVHGADTPAVKSKAGEEEEGDEDEDDEDDEDEDGEEDEDEDTTGGEQGEGELRERKLRGKKFEDKDAKKERKRAVKDEKREKRKEKMPKSAKKKQIKKTSGKKK
jgi:RIO kinase 1